MAELLPPARRVLVTGAGGLVGSEVCRVLTAQGSAVTAFDRDFDGDPAADRVVEGSADSPEAVTGALRDCDAVAHLAAIPSPHGGSPLEVYRTNVLATFTVLATAGESGIRRVALASSINANGLSYNRRKPLPAYFPLDEELPAELDDAYSLSKASDELSAAMAASRWDLRVVALRLPMTADAARIEDAARQAKADPSRSVNEGWSYLHRHDAARAFSAAVRAPGVGRHVLFLSAPDTLLDAPTEELLARWAPGVPRRRPLPGRTSTIDAGRAREILGVTARWRRGQPEPGYDPESVSA